MADALCGPSNALQNFKQHTQVDRSLQQDRLTGPRASAQGFRTHDPRAGSLDAEFHAFENATASPFQEPFAGHSFATTSHFQQPAPPNWANDFQHLSISDQPLPAQQFRNYAPLIKSTNGGWHNEYMRQQQGGHTSVAQGKQVAFEQQNISAYAPQMSYQGNLAPMSSFGPQVNMQQYPGMSNLQSSEQMAGADWSQAFEDAFQDAFKDADQVQQISSTQEVSTAPQDSLHGLDDQAAVQPLEQARIGSDAIDYTEMKDRTADQEQQDANALARVAGELLHNVHHDSSEKFQNSQFLDLMRKIRDRQVEVRNNDFETTGANVSENMVGSVQSTASITDQDIRNEADPDQDRDTFAFPDINPVYAPRQADYVDYTFDEDQYPVGSANQISHLHPGGRLYPEQSPSAARVEMSGAVAASKNTEDGGASSATISADDFEAAYDENRGLASRFQRPAA